MYIPQSHPLWHPAVLIANGMVLGHGDLAQFGTAGHGLDAGRIPAAVPAAPTGRIPAAVPAAPPIG